jgi:hypothetical protein
MPPQYDARMVDPSPDDLRALLAFFPLVMVVIAVEGRAPKRASDNRSWWGAFTGVAVAVAGFGTAQCLLDLALPGSHLLGDPVSVWWLALAATILVVISVMWTAMRRAEEGDD